MTDELPSAATPPPPPLGESARSVLDAARGAMSPDADAIARMKAKIAAQVGMVGATATAASSTGSVASVGAASRGASHTLAVKLGATLAVAALAIGIAIFGGRDDDRTVALGTAVHGVVLPAPPASPSAPTRIASTMAPTGAAPTGAAPTGAAPVAVPEIEMAPLTATKPPKKHADLAREVELVDRAMAALRRGDPKAALAAVHTHAAETSGSGQLAEDAAAIEIEALCSAGTPVTAKLTAFDTRWPHSAQRHRLTNACAR